MSIRQIWARGSASAESVEAVAKAVGGEVVRGGMLCDFFDSSKFAPRTRQFGQILVVEREVGSTQSNVSTLLSSIDARTRPLVTWTCEKQTSGRGRGGNSWASSGYGTMLTTVVDWSNRDSATMPLLQHVAALGVCQGLASQVPEDVEIRVKWPNDIYARHRGGDELKDVPLETTYKGDLGTFYKVGGILCESSVYSIGDPYSVLIGVGLNLKGFEPFADIAQLSSGPEPSREAVLASVLESLEHHVEKFRSGGWTSVEDDYYTAWLHSGQRIQIPGTTDHENIAGITGLTSDGALSAILEKDGSTIALEADPTASPKVDLLSSVRLRD